MERACALVESAIELLGREGRADDLAARFVLAPALERLMKLSVVVSQIGAATQLTDKELKRAYGHDLVALRDALVEVAERAPRFDAPPLRDDLQFVRADPLLQQLLVTLTSYGSGGRYAEFKLLTDDEPSEEPDAAWDEIEVELLTSAPGWPEADLTDPAVVRAMVVPHVEHTIRRLLRFIARLWAFEALGEVGTMWSQQLSEHLRYDD